ncbi:uncharacterized protein LY79DRAFT_572951 [Colletotrichum navitas]|uniref:BTB domain-containing protein n=1 Tax=Colletotrichum navitas TaxID=681940 RepID=A0AAD8PKI9_9PEZI|nr:uncharacterized protein LY79DRAFT_572951 [Colletotrichum navitas]KAK1566021.1 hypothetical protein LY79DRAFT_572951 [Colletotrichum navitas]
MSSTKTGSRTPALDPVKELRASLKILYEDAEYSDLIIASRDAEYRVHKAIVCPRSDYFAAKCRASASQVDYSLLVLEVKHLANCLQAAIKDILSLPDDDPRAVGMAIRYFY